MPDVLLTIDTELWPRGPLTAERVSEAIARDYYGVTPKGEVGLRYQIDVLNAYGLKAVFFVEALGASFIGSEQLHDVVQLIQENGHDVQLHVHPEWLAKAPDTLLPGRQGQHLHEFMLAEQTTLIRQGLDHLKACGAAETVAFRAGSFGANHDTLIACRNVGLPIDSSYNVAYLDDCCRIDTPFRITQPTMLNGLLEYPVSFFHDATGRKRHAQLSACSSGEMIGALNDAAAQQWDAFVILSHSFELLRWRKGQGHVALPDRVMLKRFDHLCRFLADNRQAFPTITFSEIDIDKPPVRQADPVYARSSATAQRLAEQFARRYFL